MFWEQYSLLETTNSNAFIQEFSYNNEGNSLFESIDVRGNSIKTTTYQDSLTGRVNSIVLPDGQVISYSYSKNRLSSINTNVTNLYDNTTDTVSHTFSYTKGLLTRLAVNNSDTVYTFEYDGFGVQTKVYVNGIEYAQNSYKTNCDYSIAETEEEYNYTQTEYSNGYAVKSITDRNNNLVAMQGITNGIKVEELRLEETERFKTKELKQLINKHTQKQGDILVVGLGNIYVTPDSLRT